MYLRKYYLIVIATFIFLIFIVLIYKNFLLNLNSRILFNVGDPVLNMYFLKWGADYILGNATGSSIFNLPVAFPFQNSLAFSDNLFGNQIIFLPYYIATEKPLLAFNLWIFTTSYLNYIFMFYYLKTSKFINNNSMFISIIGAIIFTFSIPSIDLLGGHLQLLPLYFIPITLLLLERLMATLKIKYFILFGLAISFQFYLGIQTGFILLVLLMLLTPVYYIYILKEKKIFFKKIWISVTVFIIPTIMLLLPYLQSSKLTGHRTYSEVLHYIPSITNIFSVGIGEKAIFVGIPTFLLFIFLTYFIRIKKSKILLGVVFLSFIFFLKEPHIFKLFFTYIPGFDSIRTPGRFIFVSIVSIAIFISVVLAKLEVKKVKIIFFIFIIGMAISLYKHNISSMKYKYVDNSISPKVLQTINHEPTLILPLYEFKNPDVLFMVRRMKDIDMQFPILDIYSGFNPTFVSEIEAQYVHEKQSMSANKKFIERIMKLGFKHIMVEKNKITNVNILTILDKGQEFTKSYEDSQVILYSNIEDKESYISLNNALQETSWYFNIKNLYTENNKTIFIGHIKGNELSGVIQKKEEFITIVKLKNKKYPCNLQLDSIKDSYSSFKCISEKSYPEFLPMAHALLKPSVKYSVIEPYNHETGTIKLKVRNTGNEIWRAGFNAKFGLALSYKIKNVTAGIEIGYDNNRFYLPYNIDVGESFEIEIPIKGLGSGENDITFSMVQELIFWFHNKGNQTLSIKVSKG